LTAGPRWFDLLFEIRFSAAKRNIIAASSRLHDRADRVDDDVWLIHCDDVT